VEGESPSQVVPLFALLPVQLFGNRLKLSSKFPRSWARGWPNDKKHLLLQPVSSAKKDISQARVIDGLSGMAKIYQWRLQFILAHGGAVALHLDLAITASRILSVDEISLFLSPDSKDAFTVLSLHAAILRNVQVHLLTDRFSGHDSPETAALSEEHHICPIVVEDTTRGAPNDVCFNHLIRTTFDNTQLQIHQDRAKANALRKRDGLPPHPNLTHNQKRQLALYVLRHVAFDLSDMFRRSFDTRSSDCINTPQCQSR
jgi:hypothetical protein